MTYLNNFSTCLEQICCNVFDMNEKHRSAYFIWRLMLKNVYFYFYKNKIRTEDILSKNTQRLHIWNYIRT